MQATEKFYNVLWWSKNASSTDRMMNLIMKVAASPGKARGTTRYHIATATKYFAQYCVYHPFASMTASTRAGIDFQSASKCFRGMLSQTLGRT